MARFLVDAMCGRLARYLRFCGHDAAYLDDREADATEAVATRVEADSRTLITRDSDLARRVGPSIHLRSTDIEGQLREVAAAGVELALPEMPRRCGRCNGRLRRLADGEDRPDYAPAPSEPIACFRCRRCGQVFWKGSHWSRVHETLERVTTSLE